MAAIACRRHRTHPAPLRLLPTLPVGRRQPSSAAHRWWVAPALAVLAALALLLGAGSLAGAGQDGAARGRGIDGRARSISSTVHVVQPGDTLWSLARQVQPEGDVRPLVARLRAQHGPGPLLPGDRLRLAV